MNWLKKNYPWILAPAAVLGVFLLPPWIIKFLVWYVEWVKAF
jgi:hypothetical protein